MLAMKRPSTVKGFGKRLAELRRSAGITQVQLGESVGVSARVIAYYEGETDYPPAHLIEPFAKALGVSIDEILGMKASKEHAGKTSLRLMRRMRKIEELPPSQQKTLLRTIDTFLEMEKFKKAG